MVAQFKEKVPIFEAAQWSTDPDEMLATSEWLSANEWPWLDEASLPEPGPERAQGHFIDAETNALVIIWPEDRKDVEPGEWIVKNRRYNELNFMNNEVFNYEYEQYGS